MALTKPDIKRIETLITEYAENNGIDNNVAKMTEITESYRKTKKLGFFDLAYLSGILNVSPDYICGLTDETKCDNPYLLKLLADAVRLNSDNLYALCLKSGNYLDIQENLIDFNKAGIVVKEYSVEGELVSETVPEKPIEYSMVAEPAAEYKKE